MHLGLSPWQHHAISIAFTHTKAWKKGRLFTDDTLKRIYWNKHSVFWLTFSVKFVPWGSMDRNGWAEYTVLSEPIMIEFTDVYMRH